MMTIMRYPDGHKAETRERIVRAAAGALRRVGVAGVSIPELMRKAGLTHGGFYGYFRDRDALVAEAIAAGASETAQAVFADELSLAESLGRYLSPRHVAHPEHGCVVAALGSEGFHQPRAVRRAFAEVAHGLLALVDKKVHPGATTRTPSDDALRIAASMVGAVVLARLVDDEELAGRILRAARAAHLE
jgi:TetR/AcrR family transcriptional repressor of nem operon